MLAAIGVAVRATIEAVIPAMNDYADRVRSLAERSENPIITDLGRLAAQYRRANTEALSTYMPVDSYVARVSNRTASVI